MDAGAIAPSAPGVYVLYRGDQLTYIGVAERGDGIEQALENHRSGACAGCEQQATGFTYELTHQPRRRHAQRLRAYRERHNGRVPPCNECQPCGC
jgi:hypothetical protein